MHKVCYLLLSLSLWCCPFSALSAPSNDNKTAQITANQLTYQQIFELQNRLAQLEAELRQQQNTKADLKDAEKDLLDLKQQLSALKVLVDNDDKNQDRRLSDFAERFNVVKERITDTQNTMNWWLSGLTLLLALAGFLAYRQSKQEAKQLAQQQMDMFINEHEPKLLADAKQSFETELVKFKEDSDKTLQDFKNQLDLLRELAQTQTDALLNQVDQRHKNLQADHKTQTSSELNAQQKRQLKLSTQLKPETEFNAEDWYRRSGAQLANEDYTGALTSIEKALQNESLLKDVDIANYLSRKANCYWRLERFSEEIATYDQLLNMFGDSTVPTIQILVANALVYKAITLSEQQKFVEAIACYDIVIEKYEDSTSPKLQAQVAYALVNKGSTFGLMKKLNESTESYKRLLVKFGDSTLPDIVIQVELAYANLAEVALCLEPPPEVLKLVEQCETKSQNTHIFAMMQFLRFILDDKPISVVIDAAKNIRKEEELTWQFAEIKPYIEANISGKKLQQCHAIIACFEEHKDVNRLAKELGLN